MNELLLREDLIIEEERLMMFKLCENGIFVKTPNEKLHERVGASPPKIPWGLRLSPPPPQGFWA